jgi:hypothetical protein
LEETINYNEPREANFVRWAGNVVKALEKTGNKTISQLETISNYAGDIHVMWVNLPKISANYVFALTQSVYASWTKAGVDPAAQIISNAQWEAAFESE